MTRLNVFGKPIVYDVGATVANNTRVPAESVKEGDDLSSFTKDQLKEHLKDVESANEQKSGQNFSNDSTNLNSYSNSSLSSNPVPAPEERTPDVSVVKKGKGQGTGLDGNKLLPSVTPNDQTVVPKYTSAVLSKNRFTSDKRRNGTEQFRVNPNHSIEGMGSWNGFRASSNGKDFGDGDLAHVGSLLTLRATKELGAKDAFGRSGPDGAAASLATILPGGSQSGLLKVDIGDLEVVDVLNSIIDNNVESANLDASKALSKHKVISISSESYGQMNNVLESFSGLLPLGMIGLSTALVLALKVAIKAILAIFLLITSASKTASKKTDTIGRHFLGDYQKSAAFEDGGFPPLPLPASLFGLRETRFPFGDCVNAGIDAFFGGGVGDSFKRILETPGFYAVFCRSIVMSSATIVDQIKDVVKGNPVQVAQNIIALVEVIKSSKVVSAMNVFAQIGDSALALKESPDVTDRKTISKIDTLPDENSTGFKSRLNGSLKLAWGVGNSPSTYLLPTSMQGALSVFSQLVNKSSNQAFSVVLKSDIKSINDAAGNENNQLDHALVESVEAKLDAEYLPFYFHDLRTNEIISFPAFLTSITDDFSVNWENSDGYGRIDHVKIYKSTMRKVGVSFIICATGPDDFDQMWVKINKLITMVYPQWTAGTVLNNKDSGTKFTQPFSQIPGASPIIRLRLGDLFRTNYSRFALARLFGLGNNDSFEIEGGGKFNVSEESIDKYSTFFKKYFDESKPLPKDGYYDAQPGFYEESEKAGGALDAVASAVGVGSAKPKQRINLDIPNPCKIVKDLGEGVYEIEFVNPVNSTPLGLPRFTAMRSQLAYNEKSMSILAEKEKINIAGLDSSEITKLGEFFSSKQNAIVRSFESVSGKGLACAIDSMNYSWLDNTPWETEIYGSRAPKMCKVTLSLSPIHDIAPGIDADGFNRAPIYNVGRAINAIGGDSWDESDKGRLKFASRVGKLGIRK